MPASEAQIRANQANAAKSRGPITPEGKERSRANALKHGMTGAGVVLPEDDAIEVDRLARVFEVEMKAEGEAGRALARRMAVSSVRMDRGFVHENAALDERVRKALDEFEAPEGMDADGVEKLRAEAAARALFDASKEACLARKYEAAAERAFFRSLKELARLKKESGRAQGGGMAAEVAAQAQATLAKLGSFLPASPKPPATIPTPPPAPSRPALKPSHAALDDWDPFASDPIEVPIAIGKRR